MNHQEVVEEDKRNKLPPNWEARKRQAEWVLEDEQKRREAEARVIAFVSWGLFFPFVVIDLKYTNISNQLWLCYRKQPLQSDLFCMYLVKMCDILAC